MANKIRFPSIDNSNPLTWKCKIFGCRDEFLPLTIYDSGEQHGIKNQGKYTAATTSTKITYKGCIWCFNYKKIMDEPVLTFPIWACYCDRCNMDEIINETS